MIQVNHLFYEYDSHAGPVLRDLDLTIPAGSYVGIIGPNGCGKTTFIRHLNGLLSPTSGEVWVEGINTRDTDQLPLIRQSVGMVFQNPDNQIVGMSVEEDVAFGPGNMGLPSMEIQDRVKNALDLVGMRDQAKRPPHTLSSGEKQLVAMAGVLAMAPKTILLDEPTAYLDPSARKRLLSVVRDLHGEGITIVHVTHTMDEIAQADDIVVLHQGRIVQQGAPARVFSRIERLRGLGLDIPTVTTLMLKMQHSGFPVRTDIFTVEDAYAELSPLMGTRSG
mgnify:CR=1 FL=1